MTRATHHPAAGATLVEMLVSITVLALGVVATLRLQTVWHVGLLEAHERSQAVRTSQHALARWRTGEQAPNDALPPFTLALIEQPPGLGGLQSGTITTQWPGRSGHAETVRIHALAQHTPPAAAAFLQLAAPDSPLALSPMSPSRWATWPPPIAPRSHEPASRPDPHWEFAHHSELLVARCGPFTDSPPPNPATDTRIRAHRGTDANAPGCHDTLARWVSGYVSGTGEMPRPVSGSMRVQFHSERGIDDCLTEDIAAEFDDAWHVAYTCVLPVDHALSTWSGRIAIIWSASPDPAVRVCRATPSQAASYVSVHGVLSHQNFWIVPAHRPCPLPSTHNGDWLNPDDLVHQP